jgi:cobalt-zinc-cadmium efflux system membrane fusion protein
MRCTCPKEIGSMKSIQIVITRKAAAASFYLSLCLTSCGHSNPGPAPAISNKPRDETPVRFVQVAEQPLPEMLDLAGKIQADPTKVFRIFPPASGRILELEVKPGDRVQRGQTLAVIASSDAGTARSDFAKAQVEAQRAASAADRQKILFEHGGVSEKDYVDARALSDTALAELARSRQRLEILNINPSATTDSVTLPSPASGVVLNVSAAPGELARSLETADPLTTIADLATVWVVGDVYEKDITKIERGKPVTVTCDAYPGREWTSRVDTLFGGIDPATRTLKVRVALKNGDLRLKPEMFAAIHVRVGARKAVVVPAKAIIHEGQTTTVFVENGGKPEQRTVTIGQTIDGKVEILAGLQPGQQVAADGAELLTGGPNEQ